MATGMHGSRRKEGGHNLKNGGSAIRYAVLAGHAYSGHHLMNGLGLIIHDKCSEEGLCNKDIQGVVWMQRKHVEKASEEKSPTHSTI